MDDNRNLNTTSIPRNRAGQPRCSLPHLTDAELESIIADFPRWGEFSPELDTAIICAAFAAGLPYAGPQTRVAA
jgi:hypothetical protein